jgi:hypothetical protein
MLRLRAFLSANPYHYRRRNPTVDGRPRGRDGVISQCRTTSVFRHEMSYMSRSRLFPPFYKCICMTAYFNMGISNAYSSIVCRKPAYIRMYDWLTSRGKPVYFWVLDPLAPLRLTTKLTV